MTKEELARVLEDHSKYLNDPASGKRADLGEADLEGANLRRANLRYADLQYANLQDADLRDTNLQDANLQGADLQDAYLRYANLRYANLQGATLPDSPTVEKLFTKIKEAIETNGNKLEMGDWHSCETTHCMAGWAIHLVGEEGYELENKFSSSVAGALIINKSCPYLEGKVPNFTASNENAMEFINQCAAQEG